MRDPRFPLGAARWRASCAAVAEAAAEDAVRHAEGHRVLARAAPHAYYPLDARALPIRRRGIAETWAATLERAQGGACFWCGGPLGRRPTVEHVLPFAHPAWPALPRVVQLLCLRLAHGACNQAHNRWRLAQPPGRLAEVDAMVLRVARRTVRQHPMLALAAARQDRWPGAAGE
jgi:hypothetical protein